MKMNHMIKCVHYYQFYYEDLSNRESLLVTDAEVMMCFILRI